ncbi:hypothetical protein FRB90_006473 [Tulasnella sp. 427]|nr:hypothetical protein FRB90_006473 [Tulasnella sp. 427]
MWAQLPLSLALTSPADPIMTYIARCPNGCANFKGDTGNVWIKIAEDGYNPNRTIGWAEENIRSFGNYTLTIPASLAGGEYLLRHEILGLQLAFYPTCIQIKLTGGGTATPTGVALPGAYKTNDPGIFMQLYTFDYQHPNYTIPGGPVILQGGPGYYGNAPTTTTTTSKAGYTTSK